MQGSEYIGGGQENITKAQFYGSPLIDAKGVRSMLSHDPLAFLPLKALHNKKLWETIGKTGNVKA